MNGANCNSKNNFMVKAIVLFSLATIAFYLLTEHRAHLLAYSSYILFFGYILLHIFMCGRHGKHGQEDMGDIAGMVMESIIMGKQRKKIRTLRNWKA